MIPFPITEATDYTKSALAVLFTIVILIRLAAESMDEPDQDEEIG